VSYLRLASTGCSIVLYELALPEIIVFHMGVDWVPLFCSYVLILLQRAIVPPSCRRRLNHFGWGYGSPINNGGFPLSTLCQSKRQVCDLCLAAVLASSCVGARPMTSRLNPKPHVA
jgi:hypothetical protein